MKFRPTGRRRSSNRRFKKRSNFRYSFQGRTTTKMLTIITYSTVVSLRKSEVFDLHTVFEADNFIKLLSNRIWIESISCDYYSTAPSFFTSCYLPTGVAAENYAARCTSQRVTPTTVALNIKRICKEYGLTTQLGFGTGNFNPGGRLLVQNQSINTIGVRVTARFRFEVRDITMTRQTGREAFEVAVAAPPPVDPNTDAIIQALNRNQLTRQDIAAIVMQGLNQFGNPGQR